MTEAEAIKFLQSQKRFMLGQEELSLSKAIAKIKQVSVSQLSFGGMLLSFSAINHSNFHSGFGLFSEVTLLVLGSFMVGLSTWSLVRLRQACKALNYATDGSSRLSGSK